MINLERAREWLGRVDVRNDVAAPSPLATLYDLIGFDEAPPAVGEQLPALGALALFLLVERAYARPTRAATTAILLFRPSNCPGVSASSAASEFHRPIRVGDPISRLTRVVDVAEREGRAGPSRRCCCATR